MGDHSPSDEDMSAPRRKILARIQELMDAQGLDMKGLSLKAGLGPTYMRDMLKRQRGGNIEHIISIADALGVSVSYLVEGSQPAELTPVANRAAQVQLIPVRGQAQAGHWMEFDDAHYEFDPIPAVLTPLGSDQFAYRVVGNSMDQRRVMSGDYVICVPYSASQPNSGSLVVVERRRGDIFERTVKELHMLGGSYELRPRSSDPRHRSIIVDSTTSHTDAGEVVEIIGVVVAIHVPV